MSDEGVARRSQRCEDAGGSGHSKQPGKTCGVPITCLIVFKEPSLGGSANAKGGGQMWKKLSRCPRRRQFRYSRDAGCLFPGLLLKQPQPSNTHRRKQITADCLTVEGGLRALEYRYDIQQLLHLRGMGCLLGRSYNQMINTKDISETTKTMICPEIYSMYPFHDESTDEGAQGTERLGTSNFIRCHLMSFWSASKVSAQ